MSTSNPKIPPKNPMRISITYILPLLLMLLLLIVALQPARAEKPDNDFPPCLAGPHSLFQDKRGAYADAFNGRTAEMAQAAEDYLKNMRNYDGDRAAYHGTSNDKAAAYAEAQKAYFSRSADTAAAYRTAGMAHQAKTVQTHNDYMSAGCPRADNAGARD